jgi:hypothetical protein
MDSPWLPRLGTPVLWSDQAGFDADWSDILHIYDELYMVD